MRIERNTGKQFELNGLGKLSRFDLGPFWHADLVQYELWRWIMRARLPQERDQALGIPQIGKIRNAP